MKLSILFVTWFYSVFASESYVTLSKLPVLQIKHGEEVIYKFPFIVRKGFHIQANPASRNNLIPTVFTIQEHKNFIFGTPKYPPPIPFRFKTSTEEVATYDGTFFIEVPIKAKKNAKQGLYKIPAKLKYQACDNENCFFPEELDLNLNITIKKN